MRLFKGKFFESGTGVKNPPTPALSPKRGEGEIEDRKLQTGGISANAKQTWVAWTNLFVRARAGI